MSLSGAQRASLDQAVATYEGQVDPETVSYLQARGFNEQAARGAHLGVVGDPLPGHDQFTGRLVIPYMTPAGCVGLKFRDMTNHAKTKYMGLPGQHPRLFNVRAFHAGTDHIAIVEGELDALILHDMVGVPAVGVPGASTWLPHMPRCFADYDRVFVICDNDTSNEQNPGQRLAKKIAEDIRGCSVIQPPDDCDVGDWFLREGAAAIRERIGL